jgi:hypothetical protein|tara:strand:+ start:1833 stop:2249 length:417 start_codon:yes stop_codon:yes gene_type:complete
MPGGNYGGSSIPPTGIQGDILYAARATTYKDWMCTSFVSSADGSFTMERNNLSTTINHVDGVQQTIFMSPSDLAADPGADTLFWCYECSCEDALTGNTQYNNTGYAYPRTNDGSGNLTHLKTFGGFAPTIIGGGGLNN